ncbi:DNA repair protein RadA, partial [Candidatus Saccharibacteria bacterium]|nr:DNA repair protein RadA [Candidatus Saccharibacteria bacterium]
MAKRGSTQFVCNNCGAISSAWSGRCNQCGEWNTIEEKIDLTSAAAVNGGKQLNTQTVAGSLAKDHKRLSTNNPEVDIVLGGGFVAGSVNLLAGQPGIGKSTLLLQLAEALAKTAEVLYVSGEESAHQIGLRAQRLGTKAAKLQLATSTSADDIASRAKQTNTALILVGHVTKEGNIAGPKVLEHVVDVVLQLEGDRYGGFKVLRAVKNRYGSTNEAGIFEMADTGLQPVSNPSAALLEERQVSDGSIVLATIEGTRPLLVEVQALVNKTSYGYPKRAASGYDLSRLNLLVAMLERRTKLNLADQDIYINIVGGIRLTEPAADLAVVMAIASAAKGLQLSKNVVVFGELGLSGEIRHVPHI